MPESIHVNDFGAIPGDGNDDTAAIQAAFEKAKEGGVREIVLDAGRYDIEALAADGRHLCLAETRGLTLRGQVDADGRPATSLVRKHGARNKKEPPNLLKCTGCENLRVENLRFGNDPLYCSAGRILSLEGGVIEVEVLPDHPCTDGMICAYLGVFEEIGRASCRERVSFTV